MSSRITTHLEFELWPLAFAAAAMNNDCNERSGSPTRGPMKSTGILGRITITLGTCLATNCSISLQINVFPLPDGPTMSIAVFGAVGDANTNARAASRAFVHVESSTKGGVQTCCEHDSGSIDKITWLGVLSASRISIGRTWLTDSSGVRLEDLRKSRSVSFARNDLSDNCRIHT